MNDELLKIYSDAKNPGSFGGVEKLYKAAKQAGLAASRGQVREFLSSLDAYTLLRAKHKKFKRNKILVDKPMQLHMSDLADMQNLQKWNDGIRYLVILIDSFTRILRVIPVRNKGQEEMYRAFVELYADENQRPRWLMTDFGTEYYNSRLIGLMRKFQIKHYSTYNSDIKASQAERIIRTLKSRLYRLMLNNLSRTYIRDLSAVVQSINNSPSRALGGLTPLEAAKPENYGLVMKHLYPENWQVPCVKHKKKRKTVVDKLKPGISVRIAKPSSVFEKGYLKGWSDQIYKIKSVLSTRKPPVFRLVTETGEPVKKTFYAQEIQKIRPTGIYRIEDIIGYRVDKKTGQKQVRIKWHGYKEPTWENQANVINPTQKATKKRKRKKK